MRELTFAFTQKGERVIMRHALRVIAIALAQPLVRNGASASANATHIRCANDRVSAVFRDALKQSPSFGELVATLELSDRMVHIEDGQCRHREQSGCLRFVPGTGGRTLVVRVDLIQPISSVVPQLAHQLYHAAEVAREPEVVDDAVSAGAVYANWRAKLPGALGRLLRNTRSSGV